MSVKVVMFFEFDGPSNEMVNMKRLKKSSKILLSSGNTRDANCMKSKPKLPLLISNLLEMPSMMRAIGNGRCLSDSGVVHH